MAISGIDSYSSAMFNGMDFTGVTNGALGGTPTNGTSNTAKNANNPYGSSSLSGLSSAITVALEGLGLSSNDRLTFNDIINYRDKLQKEFEATVKEDLKKLGVAEDIKFQLVSDKKGGITVVTDHADKAIIEKYLADNPDMAKKFQNIEALTNAEEARKTQKMDVEATRKRVQVESLTAWFANTGQSVSSIMDFTGGDTAFMAGLNKIA